MEQQGRIELNIAETVVDGEVVALDDSGRPDFHAVQHFKASASRIHYFVFDLLALRGRDLMNVPLSKRRELMKSVLKLPVSGHPRVGAIRHSRRRYAFRCSEAGT